MKSSKLFYFSFSALIVGATCSCIDNKYDLEKNSLNKNMSIFNNGISLPVGSVQEITLSQFIDTEEENSIIKKDPSGYFLSKSGDTEEINIDIEDTDVTNDGSSLEETFKKVNIFKKIFSNPLFTANTVMLPINEHKDSYDSQSYELLKNTIGENTEKFILDLSDDEGDEVVEKFTIKIDDVPEEINTIYSVEFEEFPIYLNLETKNIDNVTDKLVLENNFKIEIPNVIILGNNNHLKITEEDGKSFINLGQEVITEYPNRLTINAKGIDLGENGIDAITDPVTGKRTIEYEDAFKFHGNAFINKIYKSNETSGDYIKIPMVLRTEEITATAKKVKGKFNIDPTKESVGIDKDELPDFLSEDNIIIDAAHAAIEFVASIEDEKLPTNFPIKVEIETVKNDIVTNNLKAKFWIEADKFTPEGNKFLYKYIISDNGEKKDGFESVVIDDLNKLLYEIPDSVRVNAEIDSEEKLDVEIVNKTNINIDFALNVPLEFGKDLNISYTDTIDGIHGSFGGIKTTGVKLAGKLEYKIPVNMQLSASAIDTDGNLLEGVNIAITPEDKIKNGTHDLSIVITSEDKELIAEKLDGIALEITLTNEDYDENSSDQIKPSDSIYLKDLKISVLGGIEIDADDF